MRNKALTGLICFTVFTTVRSSINVFTEIIGISLVHEGDVTESKHKVIFCFRCDSGGDCECLCTILSHFAQECNANGAPANWRSQRLCRK